MIATHSHATRLQTQDSLRFILAWKAIATFKNSVTGNRYTYKIKTNLTGTVHFVSVLRGSDNSKDYVYIGAIFDGNTFRQTPGSKVYPSDQRFKVFEYVFRHLVNNTLRPEVEIWHEGRCGRCGRLLTVPESIESGYGPECITRM